MYIREADTKSRCTVWAMCCSVLLCTLNQSCVRSAVCGSLSCRTLLWRCISLCRATSSPHPHAPLQSSTALSRWCFVVENMAASTSFSHSSGRPSVMTGASSGNTSPSGLIMPTDSQVRRPSAPASCMSRCLMPEAVCGQRAYAQSGCKLCRYAAPVYSSRVVWCSMTYEHVHIGIMWQSPWTLAAQYTPAVDDIYVV